MSTRILTFSALTKEATEASDDENIQETNQEFVSLRLHVTLHVEWQNLRTAHNFHNLWELSRIFLYELNTSRIIVESASLAASKLMFFFFHPQRFDKTFLSRCLPLDTFSKRPKYFEESKLLKKQWISEIKMAKILQKVLSKGNSFQLIAKRDRNMW